MLIAIHIIIQVGLITRILLRQHRDPASRIAWIVVVLALPVVGIVAYLLLGETNIGARRAERLQRILAAMPKVSQTPGWDAPMLHANIPEFYRPLFNVGRSISCGSQNCADPAFLPKAKYAPWVDAVMRFEGAVARQNQSVFATDWMTYYDDDIRDLLRQPIEAPTEGFPAQVIASGPTVRHSAMPEMFESLIYSARHELVITTPYYVPDDALQGALCAAGNRGVAVTIVFPARNDDFAVAATSRSYYLDLLAAGVNIYEYVGGLLHTKSLTLDRQITLIGSANMDRRSFDLNYENNILLSDPAVTVEMRRRQDVYIAQSKLVTAAEVNAWSWWEKLRNNALAMLGPVL
jgi:cardiolipin synthase